jgi:type I restriction enzyme S subunit
VSWPVSILDKHVDILSGFAFKSSFFNENGEGLPLIRIRDVVGGQSSTYYSGEYSKDFIIENGDLLVGMDGDFNRERWSGDRALLNQRVCKITAKGEALDQGYLYHFLPKALLKIHSETPAVTVKHLSVKGIKDIEIPLPLLTEQKRIAAILDKADAIRCKRQQAIQLADEFLRAVFLDMFGDPVTNPRKWDEYVLKDIAEIRSGVTKGKKVDPSTAVTLPYMRVANVQDGYLDLSDIQNITVSSTDAEKCRLINGDILLTEGGDPDKLGRGYVWHGEIENCIHQNHIFSVRIHDQNKIDPLFLSAVIGSQRGKRYFLKVGKQTTGIATINKTVLSEFMPFLPPYKLQLKYVEVLKKIQAVKRQYKSANTGLFESLSQKAFSGKL